MNLQNPSENFKSYQTDELPPAYSQEYPSHPNFPQHQTQIYQIPNVIQIANPVYYQQPILPVYRNNAVIVNTRIASIPHQRYQYICQPEYLSNININRINLSKNIPKCYIVFHCIVTIILALIQIAAEYVSVKYLSFYYEMTVGWYLGGLMVFFSISTMCNVCVRTLSYVKVSVCINLLLLALNVGFALVVPLLDMVYSTRFNHDNSHSQNDFNYIINADIFKIISGAIAIKMYFIYALVMIKTIKNSNQQISRTVYVQSNSCPQNQVIEAQRTASEN